MLKKNIEKEQRKDRRKTFIGIRPARFESKKQKKFNDAHDELDNEESEENTITRCVFEDR